MSPTLAVTTITLKKLTRMRFFFSPLFFALLTIPNEFQRHSRAACPSISQLQTLIRYITLTMLGYLYIY